MQNYHLFSDDTHQWTLTREGCESPVGTSGSKLEGVMSCCQFLRRREGSLQLHTGGSAAVRRVPSRAYPLTQIREAGFGNTRPAA